MNQEFKIKFRKGPRQHYPLYSRNQIQRLVKDCIRNFQEPSW